MPKGIFNNVFMGFERKKAYRYAVYAGIPLLILVVGFTLYGRYLHLKKSVAAAERNIGRMDTLRKEYTEKKAAFETMAAKVIPTGVSPVSAIELMAKRTGIKDKIISIKPLEEKGVSGYTDRAVEVRLEALDMNHLVNFLYQAEHGDRLVIIRDLSIKERFENRELLDVTLKASVVTKP
ncbi:MAG TPA: hypothetical protein DDW94_12650 [Deltaproteobacteria bacterium]|nr:MAG: hypothetical protein A2Z79_07125 [Deltaproteobacteria bacterium GWA2_55_82]OGQ63223.1 MAG: hypothetical protein A3I81_00475 [Deltaproteobacteria bacterium RIFCSPLOWO2_02_FULL_55_12]OIJ73058.1 MAG: hypothetical protein A2V21_301540 [Deltaproteobacteria bacterium GWC2_55_46]HBG47819.1 hypothetical protein [Deltaproteobacteria bacterium]HCY11918.1 hypothetical protein [Deltaproteobacteria bacterium]